MELSRCVFDIITRKFRCCFSSLVDADVKEEITLDSLWGDVTLFKGHLHIPGVKFFEVSLDTARG